MTKTTRVLLADDHATVRQALKDLIDAEHDMIVVGEQLVVAWTDNTDPETAPDIRYRTFDASGSPGTSFAASASYLSLLSSVWPAMRARSRNRDRPRRNTRPSSRSWMAS